MKKQLAGQRTVSANHVMSASVEVEAVEGMDEVEEQQKSRSPAEIGLVKRWKVEGKIGECFYSIHFLAICDVSS